MNSAFNSLTAAEALEAAGMEARQARACATQMNLAASAGEPVSRSELDQAVTKIRMEIAEVKTELEREIAGVRGEIAGVRGEVAEVKGEVAEVKGEIAEMRGEIAEMKGEIIKVRSEIKTEFAEMEARLANRMVMFYWQMFASMAAITGLAVALFKYLP